MIRTGNSYRDGLRDGREVWMDGERVRDVTMRPALRPIIYVKARNVAALDMLWTLYKPQLDDYVARALDPSAVPGYGVPGDP